MKRGVSWKALIVSLLVVFAVAGIGSYFTKNASSSWYQEIKPSITPPNFVFPIVWTVLFILIAISLYFAWVKTKDKSEVALAFGSNFFVNIIWSIIFFYLKSPSIAFLNIILLVFSIVMLMIVAYKADKKAFYLLIPYLLWVLFATILNYLAI